ncbi:hypothetical protein EC845_1939 [Comamonas sp. BIGb0124]|nr:hypothetical protein EC845_1939 [Comamonas sp. BIGb0124]
MLTELIEGVDVRVDDEHILAILDAHAKHRAAGVRALQIFPLAIKNEAGVIYRLVEASGARELRALNEALLNHGLHNETGGLSQGKFISIYV